MTRSLANLMLVLSLIVLSSCQAMPLFSKVHYLEVDSRHPLMEVLCVWEPAEGRGVDNAPCRGFGGQILCFASGYKEPVKVSGDVRIYVFDDKGVNGDTSLPIHQFDFTAEAWNTFLKPSSLGASYQIFVPYTRKGTEATSCTLRVRLTPEGGLPIYSRMATVSLAGQGPERSQKQSDGSVTTISHSELSAKSQGITTADFSDLVNSPQAARELLPVSQTSGISMARQQDTSRELSQLKNSLRHAAEEASRSTNVDSPEEQPPPLALTLKPLERQLPAESRTEREGERSDSPQTTDRVVRSNHSNISKVRHPLEDLD